MTTQCRVESFTKGENMTDCSCGTCECQTTIQNLERQQLENLHTIANLEMQVSKLQKKKMFPTNIPPRDDIPEEECIACSA